MPSPEQLASSTPTPPRDWRRFGWLAYLLLYPLPWFNETPSLLQVLGATAGIAAYVPLYAASSRYRDRRGLVVIALTLAIGLALMPCGGVWTVFVVFAAATAGQLKPRRLAVFGAVGSLVVLVVASVTMGASWQYWVPMVIITVMVVFSTWMAAALEERNRQLAESRDLSRRLAVTAERERIARDLHDLLGHTLTAVAVKADLASRVLASDPARAHAEIDDIARTARAALADIRGAVTGMRSATLAAELAQARSALGAAGVALVYRGPERELPPALESTAAFVIREALTNVVRHAQARSCTVDLVLDERELRVEIGDDGRGATAPEGNGLAGMRSRVAQHAGRLEITGADTGTRVVAHLPLLGALA
jgi:two-component system, NarL family, sensor histidine kinase DesK